MIVSLPPMFAKIGPPESPPQMPERALPAVPGRYAPVPLTTTPNVFARMWMSSQGDQLRT